MSRKKIIVTCFIVLLLLILIAIGIIVFRKKEVKNVGSFYDNQNQVAKIKISVGNGWHGIITDKDVIADIFNLLDQIQVKKSSPIPNRYGWWFNLHCYNENDEEIFVLANEHPWLIKGNLSEGYYEIVSNDEFEEIFEQKIDPHTKPSAISSNFAP